jgi:hypothetical protein
MSVLLLVNAQAVDSALGFGALAPGARLQHELTAEIERAKHKALWMGAPHAFGLSSQRPGPGELILVLYGGPRWSFWRPPLLSGGAGSFVCPSIHEVLGPPLSYPTPLKHPGGWVPSEQTKGSGRFVHFMHFLPFVHLARLTHFTRLTRLKRAWQKYRRARRYIKSYL